MPQQSSPSGKRLGSAAQGKVSQTGSQREKLGVERLPKTQIEKKIYGNTDLDEKQKTCHVILFLLYFYLFVCVSVRMSFPSERNTHL